MSGMFAPAKTPAPIISRLNGEIVKALERRDVKERFLTTGTEAVGSTPQELDAYIRAEIDRWTKLIERARIQPD